MMMTRVVVTGASLLAATALTRSVALARADDSRIEFQSPSGNIACVLSAVGGGFVECDIGSHTYLAAPRPEDCRQGWGDRFSLDRDGPPAVHCHGDTLQTHDLANLDYGQSLHAGGIGCESLPAGVRCVSSTSGHSFLLSRERYEIE